MVATHKVKNSSNETVGFIINNKFVNNYLIKSNIANIENLNTIKNGNIRAKRQLPVVSYRELMKAEYKRINTESPFKRDIEEELKIRRNNKGVIQLNGPRQCGKTTELKKFAYKNYEYIVYINLADKTGELFKQIIQSKVSGTDLAAVIDIMSVYCEKANLPSFKDNITTILIIDEIQLEPSIYNMLRSLREQYKIDIIVTGSYLGATVFNNNFFLPAGTVEELHMLPLSFKEFVRIFNRHSILDTISLYGESDTNEYNIIYELYEVYRKIGGYPDVVKEYIRSKDTKQCMRVLGKILNTFTKESRNYFDTTKHDIIFKSLYSSAFIQMCHNKKGAGAKLVEDVTKIIKDGTKMIVSKDEISKSLLWIAYSKVLGQCDLYVEGDITNILPARRFYYLDCGLATYIGNTTGIDKASIDGLITETFVYSELYRLYMNTYSLDKVKGDNPGFSTISNYELDFLVIGIDNKVYGIEVKTTDGDAKSLKIYLQKRLIDKGIIVKKTKGGKRDKIDTIPIWAVGCRFPYNK